MSFLELLLLSFALAADAFTVGTTVGLRHRTGRQLFRLSFHFGLFQSLLAAAGALAGTLIIGAMHSVDHWIACALLVAIGARMIYGALKSEHEQAIPADLTRGFTMVGLSVAVSIDAFAVGIGLPAANADLPLAIGLIGLVAGLATLTAMKLAGRIPLHFAQRMEIVAGLVLIGLGVWTPIGHVQG